MTKAASLVYRPSSFAATEGGLEAKRKIIEKLWIPEENPKINFGAKYKKSPGKTYVSASTLRRVPGGARWWVQES